MQRFGGIVILALLGASSAHAGAWPQAKGHGQLIVNAEASQAHSLFVPGGRVPLGHWSAREGYAYTEYGLSKRFTITGKVNLKDYHTDFSDFSGVSSIEVGGRWTVKQSETSVLAVGASVEGGGKGRRNDFELGGRTGTDYEVRAYSGRSFMLREHRFDRIEGFSDIQVARRWREHDASQWRVDATFGLKPSTQWLVMAQVFAGRTDQAVWGRASWANAQVSVVRRFGPDNRLGVQAGVRRTIAGRNVPKVDAIVIGLWRDF